MVGNKPIFDCRDLGRVRSNLTYRYNMAKRLNLGYAKLRLCKLGLKLTIFETLEDPAEVLQMLLRIGAKYQNVVQIKCHEMILGTSKCFMHQMLE